MAELLGTRRGQLTAGESPWVSDAVAASGLPDAAGRRRVEPFGEAGLLRVRLVLQWDGGRMAVRETLVRGRP